MPATSAPPWAPADLLDEVPVLLVRLDLDGRVCQVNRQFEQLTEWSRDEACGRDWFSTFVPERDRERIRGVFLGSLEGAATSWTINPIVTRAGEEREIEWQHRALHDDAGRAAGVVSIGLDVTDRLRAERALRERGEELRRSQVQRDAELNEALAALRASETRLAQANAKLEQTLASISDGFFTLESRDWTYTYINLPAARLVGRTVEQLSGKRIWEEFPEGIGSALDLGYRRVAAEGVPLTIFDHFAPLDVYFEANVYPMPGGVSVYVRNVTAQKRAEVALLASETRFRNLMEQASEAIFIADTEAKYLDVNPAACELVGFSREELLRMTAYDLLVDPVVQGLEEEMPEIRSGAANRRAWKMRRKDGSVVDVEASVKLLSDGRVLGLTRDITQQNKTEAALRENQRGLTEAQRLAKIGSWELDLRTSALHWSDEIFRIFDIDPVRFAASYEAFLDAIHPDDRDAVNTAYTRSVATREPYEITHRLRMGDGQIKYVHERCETQYADDGTPLRSVGTVQDITRQRQAEAALRDREMRHATIFNHSSDAMLLLSVGAGTDLGSALRVAAVNQSCINRVRHLADVEEATLIGLTFEEFSSGIHTRPPEVLAEYLGSLAQVIDTQTAITFEHAMLFATGMLFAEVTLVPIVDDGACKYVLWSSHDITAKKQAEAEIRASLAEKETLLREIHHRVKNNLQIISSLVHFHMKKVRSPADLTVFAELRERLLAMTLVHERLYQSTDLSRVDLGEYLRSLVVALGRSFELRGGIRVEVDSDDVRLPIELALPCGMVVCELMTNAFKYAFPGAREGTVALSVRSAEGRVVLGVDDDGVGFPDGFDARAGGSFGWDLVRSLVVQLDGSVETTTDRGAHVRVSFATAAEPPNEP